MPSARERYYAKRNLSANPYAPKKSKKHKCKDENDGLGLCYGFKLFEDIYQAWTAARSQGRDLAVEFSRPNFPRLLIIRDITLLSPSGANIIADDPFIGGTTGYSFGCGAFIEAVNWYAL